MHATIGLGTPTPTEQEIVDGLVHMAQLFGRLPPAPFEVVLEVDTTRFDEAVAEMQRTLLAYRARVWIRANDPSERRWWWPR